MNPINRKTQYSVTFKSMFGLALVSSMSSFVFIGGAILYKKPLLVGPGVLLFALLVAVSD